jgi:adenine deaminase
MRLSTQLIPRLAALFVLAIALPAGAAAKTLIHAGRLIDGVSDTARISVTVTVDKGRIVGVVDGFAAPSAGDTVIDLKNQTLMPGWMDRTPSPAPTRQG